MTELSQNERDERLARLAARGRVARPAAEATTAESHEPTSRRTAPASGRAKHPAGRSRLFTGIMSAALALGLVGGLTAAGHQAAQATAATPTQSVVVVPTSGSSGSTTRSVATTPVATATPAPSTTSGGS
jgi:hypothetical protein